MTTVIVYSTKTGEPVTAINVNDLDLQGLLQGCKMVIPISVNRVPLLVERGEMPQPAWTHLTLVPSRDGKAIHLWCNDDDLARGLPSVLLPGQADPKPWP